MGIVQKTWQTAHDYPHTYVCYALAPTYPMNNTNITDYRS